MNGPPSSPASSSPSRATSRSSPSSRRLRAAAARRGPRWCAMLAGALLLGACEGGPGAPGLARLPSGGGALSLNGSCEQKEEDGFREQARLDVRSGVVEHLHWQLWVGRRGSCRFELKDFVQTRSRPHIELSARDRTGCRLLVYQDQRRVTLAHADCENRCSGGIYDEAWPVMFDPASGLCANLERR